MQADPLSRLNAALSGRYRVERPLGEGGMATVYLAEDLKHPRHVALKVLKPELAAVVGAERFLAEIRTTASLQHPHILPLFDSGEADKLIYYVMPRVEGESLRARLDREHQLPVDEAVRIATNVAEALDYAHRHRVIHRDIKPANILLLDGKPVIADFGIALAVSHAGGGRLTETGLSLGTPHYMSPEQATGDGSVGPATDIWALGCVLYEMLVGEPPYTGSTPQAILGKIITGDLPSASGQRKSVPANVDAAIRRALEKLPADRFGSAEEFTRALADSAFRHGEPASAPAGARAGVWNPVSIGASVLAAVFALTTVWSLTRGPQATPGVPTRVVSTPERGLSSQAGTHLGISDDGEWMAWITNPRNGTSQLYVRRAGERAGRIVPDSEGARDPVFSPDGGWVAFMAQGSLRRAPVAGGPALTIASEGFYPSDWGEDGTIVGEEAGVLYRVRSVGGEVETILEHDAQGRAGYTPRFLPGAEAVLFTSYLSEEDTRVGLLDLRTGEVRTLVEAGANASYLPTGHIVYGHADQALFAVEFDLRRREVRGDPVPVLQPVLVAALGFTQFAVSSTGTAVFQAASGFADASVVLVDTTGAEELLAIDPGGLSSPRFAPDGRSVSYVAAAVFGDVYVYSLYQRNSRRMTFEGLSSRALWSRDGEHLIFASNRAGTQQYDIFRTNADLTGATERFLSLPGSQWPEDVSRDGSIVFFDQVRGRGWDLRLADPRGDSVLVTDLLAEDWAEFAASLSPDERWLAYVSNEDGVDEVYVTAFPVPAGRVKISLRGGGSPVWHPSGTSLFYVDDRADLVEARLRIGPSIDVIGQRRLFPAAAYAQVRNQRQYDVSPDGGRFVMLRISGESTAGDELVIVTNWFEELRERLGR